MLPDILGALASLQQQMQMSMLTAGIGKSVLNCGQKSNTYKYSITTLCKQRSDSQEKLKDTKGVIRTQ